MKFFNSRDRIANLVVALAGAWFVVAARALNPMQLHAFTDMAVIAGGITLILSVWALFDRERRAWRSAVKAFAGLVLGLTPLMLHFAAGHPWALWLSVGVGALILATGVWQILASRHETHDTQVPSAV